ncbi:hypothetical protein [Bacillus sp. THAF10]|uniref:hypothetical protein n=1 Tax=Bacillus sp. THAF10 TaxID=2587848 RepID=UPI001267ED6D|nr:hypothetical protein [Bacillus sp. THAF10]
MRKRDESEKVIAVYKKISQLKIKAKNEKDKLKRKRLKKEVEKLQQSLPNIKRKVYEKQKRNRGGADDKFKEEQIKKKEEEYRQMLIKEDLERRKNRKKLVVTYTEVDKSAKACPSCGVPYNLSSGFSRCRCS